MKILSQIMNSTIIILFTFSVWAEPPKITISSSGNVYLYDIVKGERNIFISNTSNTLRKPFGVSVTEDDCFLGSPYIDPFETKIAFLGNCKFPKDGDFGKNREGHYRLKVMDIKTKSPLVIIKHAARFCFSPKGDAILYITGYPGERGAVPIGYEPGIFIYNFDSKTKTEISSPVGACDFNWSPHDGNIYFTNDNNNVFQYDASRGQGKRVTYKGIYFSPNKNYVISNPCAEDYSHIYRLSDNRDMTEWINLLLQKSEQWPVPTGYIPALWFQFYCQKLNAAVVQVRDWKNLVLDLNRGAVIGEFFGQIRGTNPDGSLVLVNPVKSDNPQQIDHSKVEIINLLELIKK